MTNLLSWKEAKNNDKANYDNALKIDSMLAKKCQEKDKKMGKGCLI